MSRHLVLVHGMFGRGDGIYWENYRPFFEAAGYVCHTPTLPAHRAAAAGAPDPALGALSIADYAAFLAGFIARLPETPVVLGHSMGGLLAQLLASRGLASAAVLMTPAPPAGILAAPSQAGIFLPTMFTGRFWAKPFRFGFERFAHAALNRTPAAEHRRIYEDTGYESGRVLAELSFWPAMRNPPTAVDEAAVRCPVLVVGGRDDRLTPVSTVRKIAKKYKQAVYREYAGHAHHILGEPGWEAVAGDVRTWLRAQEAAGAGG